MRMGIRKFEKCLRSGGSFAQLGPPQLVQRDEGGDDAEPTREGHHVERARQVVTMRPEHRDPHEQEEPCGGKKKRYSLVALI